MTWLTKWQNVKKMYIKPTKKQSIPSFPTALPVETDIQRLVHWDFRSNIALIDFLENKKDVTANQTCFLLE